MTVQENTHHWGDDRYIDITYLQDLDVHVAQPDDLTWEGSSPQKVANDNLGTATITINAGTIVGSGDSGAGIVDAHFNGVTYHMRVGKSITVPQAIKNQLIDAGYSVT